MNKEVSKEPPKIIKKLLLFFIVPVFIFIIVIAILPGDDNTPDEIKQMQIENQFSGFDSYHIQLVNYVKQNMNDPNSFEHIDTKHWELNDYLIVQMTFTGQNVLGGVVKQNIKAKCNIDNGNIIEILDYN
jgi:hypothetical protein